LFYGESLAGLRVADLGCLEGAFALALATRGADVLGIEARKKNLDKANLLREHFGLPNLAFVQRDGKDFDPKLVGMVDLILALGILYHLEQPVRWIRQISESARRILVLDTHFAPADEDLHLVDPRINRLGPLEKQTIEGLTYEGRWFREVEGRSVDPDTDLWAAYSNDSSFWLTKEALIRALCQSGFDLVFEQQDWIADRYRIYTTSQVRVLFVAAKTNGPADGATERQSGRTARAFSRIRRLLLSERR